jgi:hypothetical protein
MGLSGAAFAGQLDVDTEQERPLAVGWQGTIVAQVDDHAEIGAGDLAAAEQLAERIYEAIGVRVMWVHREVPLQDPRGLRVHLRLLSRTMAKRKISKERIKADVLGQANRASRNVYVFFHRIVPVAIKHRQNYARVLGLVMAHEMGHLLLPADGHSDIGIMSAHPDVWSKSVRYFTAEQGAAILSLFVEDARSDRSDPAGTARTSSADFRP